MSPEQHMRLGRRAIAPRPSKLLIIRFQAARQIGMKNEPHVGLVDTHAEGDGRRHHHRPLGHEQVLIALAFVLAHAGVIGARLDTVFDQQRRRLFGALAR
jgi:hypothetical protein